jgi:hypothetical protein
MVAPGRPDRAPWHFHRWSLGIGAIFDARPSISRHARVLASSRTPRSAPHAPFAAERPSGARANGKTWSASNGVSRDTHQFTWTSPDVILSTKMRFFRPLGALRVMVAQAIELDVVADVVLAIDGCCQNNGGWRKRKRLARRTSAPTDQISMPNMCAAV